MNAVCQPSCWEVRSFYNQSGRSPGQMAIHTWHTSEVSRDMEIGASKSRLDIGRVEVRDANGPWRSA